MEADKDKCQEEREKPVWQQRGVIECLVCERWFKSRGVTVHRCHMSTSYPDPCR